MECANQFVARRTYYKLLNSIGCKEAINIEQVKRNGIGYHYVLKNFSSLLYKYGIKEESMFNYLDGKIRGIFYEDLIERLINVIAKNKKDKTAIEELIRCLEKKPETFEKLLKDAK